MQVAMLGSLEVRADRGEVLEVGEGRLRALLSTSCRYRAAPR